MAITIDYIGILQYQDGHRELSYMNPEKEGLSPDERAKYTKMREEGQWVAGEITLITDACKDKYGLDYCVPVRWLDASNTKAKKYLWAQMKYSQYADSPISISIFVEYNGERGTEYRVSLEIRNDGVDQKTMERYHSYLDIPVDKESGLVFAGKSNNWGRPIILTDSQEAIKEKIIEKQYNKVQLCKYIKNEDDADNDYYHTEIMEAVGQLIPYYDHVLGTDRVTYWPSKDEYDPGISAEKWIDILNNTEVISEDALKMLTMMLELGGEATCTKLANVYGGSFNKYNAAGKAIGRRVHEYYGVPLCDDNGKTRYFPIPFIGRHVMENGNNRYSWKIREELIEALKAIDLPEVTKGKEMKELGLNTILYGPPGTGKTYNTIAFAVAIIEKKTLAEVKNELKNDYEAVKARYEQYKDGGQIAFTTFHQSYGYEEFIEGISPVLDSENENISYTIKSGVFKEFCDSARPTINTEEVELKPDATTWYIKIFPGAKTPQEILDQCIKEGTIRMNWKAEDLNKEEEHKFLRQFKYEIELGDFILVSLGAGIINAVGVFEDGEAYWDDKLESHNLARNVQWLAYNMYSDLKKYNNGVTQPRFVISKLKNCPPSSVQKMLIDSGAYNEMSNEKNYVFIIDEINRGNISKIFGELITLIEEAKRAGMEEAMEVTLPYSKSVFSVPSNVYILGTMNTADRSIAIMDTALRRRFDFIEMMPDADVLSGIIVSEEEKNVNISSMLRRINERIEYLFDREHTIGHAFFIKLRDDPSLKCLASIFRNNVVPLLQEYFYEDYEKIQLVLGDNAKLDPQYKFILEENLNEESVFKGTIAVDLPEKKYRIQDSAFDKIESYIQIL